MNKHSEVAGKRAPSRDYRDLVVWQEGIALAKEVYVLVKGLPQSEAHALTDQARRAAISVPSNIAEGQGRKNAGDFGRFLCIALGSLAELDTQLVLMQELGYAAEQDIIRLQNQIVQL